MLTREQVIRLLREMKGSSSQTDLARRLNVSPMYVSDLLNGKRDPGEKVLVKLGLERVIRYKRVA